MAHLLICATQRSGSTLVAELLAQTGLAGNPDEHLLLWQREPEGLPAAHWLETLQRTIDRGIGSNGIFSCKVMASYFPAAMGRLRVIPGGEDLTDWQIAERAFLKPAVVRVRRRDRLRQAISTAIAEATGVWHMARRDGERDPFLRGALSPRRDDHARDVPFDYERIRAHLAGIEAGERYWDETFAAHGVTPIEIVYEEFVQDRRAATLALLAALHIEHDPASLVLDEKLDRLSNATNDRFVALYQSESARRTEAGPKRPPY